MPQGNLQELIPIFVFAILMLVMFWWAVIRPTSLRQKKHQNLVDTLKVGDRVVTVGGMFGKIVNLGEKSLGVEIAKGVTVTFDRRAIRRKQEQEDF
jgi:preprotein translocase subunit YajC